MPKSSTVLDRRDFLITTSTIAGSLSLAACSDAVDRVVAPASTVLSRVDARTRLAQVEHVIVVMMENRSFDHFLGWHPRADGRQAGLTYSDREGNRQHTFHLAPDFQGCGLSDPDHSFDGGRIEYNAGACDGWLVAGDNDAYAI